MPNCLRHRTFLDRVVLCPFIMLLLVGWLGVGWHGQSVEAQQNNGNSGPRQGRQISLRDQLVYGLRATTQSDLAFIDKVVKKVEKGKLPRSLVDSTFLWARERANRKSETRRLRPMVYFEPALKLRAKRLGITL